MTRTKPRLTQAERTDISDQKMVDATVQLITKHGTTGTNLKDVGILAGFSRGLASQRFGSKENLFAFTLLRLSENWLIQLKSATESRVGLDAIEKALDQHYKFCVDAPDQVRTMYSLWFESLGIDSELSTKINNIHQRRQADVVEWIERDISLSAKVKQQSEQIAAQFCASVVGIIYYWLANPDQLELVEYLHSGLKNTMATLLAE